MVNSKRKGNGGEWEWARFLRERGFSARRGRQHYGIEPQDIVTPLPFHFEVKRVEKLNVNQAMAQAIADAAGKTPVVAHRRNRGEWLVTLRAEDWMEGLI